MRTEFNYPGFPGLEGDVFSNSDTAHVDFLEISNGIRRAIKSDYPVGPHSCVRITNNHDLVRYLCHNMSQMRVSQVFSISYGYET